MQKGLKGLNREVGGSLTDERRVAKSPRHRDMQILNTETIQPDGLKHFT